MACMCIRRGGWGVCMRWSHPLMRVSDAASNIQTHWLYTSACFFFFFSPSEVVFSSGQSLGHIWAKFLHLTIMKWLSSVRAMLARGSRSAPVSPVASPNLPCKADLRAKQVRWKTQQGCMFNLGAEYFLSCCTFIIWLSNIFFHVCLLRNFFAKFGN